MWVLMFLNMFLKLMFGVGWKSMLVVLLWMGMFEVVFLWMGFGGVVLFWVFWYFLLDWFGDVVKVVGLFRFVLGMVN